MRRRTIVTGALAMATAISACGVRAEGDAQIRDDDDVPFGLLDEGAPPLVPPTTSSVTDGVPLCFLDGDGLTVVVTDLGGTGDLLAVARALADPPVAATAELRTAFGGQRLVRELSVEGGVARVDLLPAITDLGGDEQLLAVAQLVCTLTGQPGVGPVAFTLEGASVDVPRGDGSLTSEPVSRDDYADLLDGDDP